MHRTSPLSFLSVLTCPPPRLTWKSHHYCFSFTFLSSIANAASWCLSQCFSGIPQRQKHILSNTFEGTMTLWGQQCFISPHRDLVFGKYVNRKPFLLWYQAQEIVDRSENKAPLFTSIHQSHQPQADKQNRSIKKMVRSSCAGFTVRDRRAGCVHERERERQSSACLAAICPPQHWHEWACRRALTNKLRWGAANQQWRRKSSEDIQQHHHHCVSARMSRRKPQTPTCVKTCQDEWQQGGCLWLAFKIRIVLIQINPPQDWGSHSLFAYGS